MAVYYMKTFLKHRTFCPTFTRFMTDIPLNCDGHLACLSCSFSVYISDIMSDVLRENVGHGVQNVGHVRMSDDFSYTLIWYIQIDIGLD